MNKKWSLYLGKFAGIGVYVHWTFIILVGWIFIINYRHGQGVNHALEGVGFILAIFACVVLHEFGHALTARRFNAKTRDITLYPIGGVASLEAMPEKPGQELLVAIAGPLVNVVIAIFLYMVLAATNQLPSLESLQSAEEVQHIPFLLDLLMANIILAVFNLIPAFPMDGGRVLRALLSFKMDRTKATRVAAGIGQFLAIAFVFLGFFYNFWLVFIGLFIYLGAGGEAAYERSRHALAGYTIKDVLMTNYRTLSTNDSLATAVQLLLDGQDQEFIVKDGDEYKGILTRRDLINGLSAFGNNAIVGQSMRTDIAHLSPDMPLDEVIQKIASEKSSVFPVMQEGRLVGLVDKENINELLMVQSAIAATRK